MKDEPPIINDDLHLNKYGQEKLFNIYREFLKKTPPQRDEFARLKTFIKITERTTLD